MASIMAKQPGKWFGMTCLLLNLSLLSLVLFPLSLGTTIKPSSLSSSDSAKDILERILQLNHNSETSKNLKQRSPFESLFKTFKDIIDGTKKNVETLSSSTLEDDTNSISQSQSEDFSYRRVTLLEQSLSEHYTQQFQRNFSQFKDHNHILGYDEDASKTGSLRWRQIESGDTICYCFSERHDSHWSFQWCPETREVYQGRRNTHGLLKREHNLGRNIEFDFTFDTEKEKLSMLESLDNTKYLIDHAISRHPDASVTPFVNGDSCIKGETLKRSAVIVMHKRSSSKCSERIQKEQIIESVEEVRICQYLLHVCTELPNVSSSVTDDNGEIQSDENDYLESSTKSAESSFHDIRQRLHKNRSDLIGYYARKSRTDSKRKSKQNISASLHSALPPLPRTRIDSNMKLIQDMFIHAYDSYMYHGYPASEVKPISCRPADFNLVKIPGLTLIDSLDTLVVLGNYTEFARAVERLRYLDGNLNEATGLYTPGGGLFSINYNVSVFETNIRVLGGLLSAHQLANAFLDGKVLIEDVWAADSTVLMGDLPSKTKKDCVEGEKIEGEILNNNCNSNETSSNETSLACEQQSIPVKMCRNETGQKWVYDGFLLDLARDIGDRLLPAFDTQTGIPYGTVNLLSGVPEGETPIASLAGGGTLSIEMELLSRMTGNYSYGRAAKLATRALWMRRSHLNLLGKHICTRAGEWSETLSGIGSNSDSFYEYLIKHHLLFPEDSDFWLQLVSSYVGVYNQTRIGEWYGDVDMFRGKSQNGAPRRVLEALMAFYPGMQVLLGEITPAARTLNSFFLAREYLGFLPERFQFGTWKVDFGGGTHLLRPELLESAYFLHRSTKGIQNQFRTGQVADGRLDSSGWLWSGDFALHSTEKLTRTECGYGSIREVSPETSGNVQAERKEVRLLDEMPSYFLSETLKYLFLLFDDGNILHTDEERDWIFTTEAHPVHYETKETSLDSKLKMQKEELKVRLRRRLAKKDKTSRSGLGQSLIEEQWTEKSNMMEFLEQVNPLASYDKNTYKAQRGFEAFVSRGSNSLSTATERIYPHDTTWSPFDHFNERVKMLNPSYLSFRKLGNEMSLTNSCPNLYNTNFLWIRALNGGINDYSDSYKSRTNDSFLSSENDMIELGSIDALALHGTGAHIESFYRDFFQCPVRNTKASSDEKKSDALQNGDRQGDLGNGSTRYEMGHGMGSFDIAAFPEGMGFSTKHVESGEMIVTTLISGEVSNSKAGNLVLVYAKDGRRSPHDSRSVVLGDSEGNAYSCTVDIIESKQNPKQKENTCRIDNDEDTCGLTSSIDQKVVRRIPCSVGLFGPTSITNLKKVQDLKINGEIQSSKDEDIYGCGQFSIKSTSRSQGEIQDRADDSKRNKGGISVIYRGDCTFQEKSYNLKVNDSTEGIIVINTEKNDEIFVMSGGGSEELSKLQEKDYPVTVIVSWNDGEQMLKLMNEKKENKMSNSVLNARISIYRDRLSDDSEIDNSAPRETKFWPRVKASAQGVEVYSRYGWGIHAMESAVDNNSADSEGIASQWQMILTKHEMSDIDIVP